jgi:hypothetical protein
MPTMLLRGVYYYPGTNQKCTPAPVQTKNIPGPAGTNKNVHWYKQKKYPGTNKNCTPVQTKNVPRPRYKQKLYPGTNKSCTPVQTKNVPRPQ